MEVYLIVLIDVGRSLLIVGKIITWLGSLEKEGQQDGSASEGICHQA